MSTALRQINQLLRVFDALANSHVNDITSNSNNFTAKTEQISLLCDEQTNNSNVTEDTEQFDIISIGCDNDLSKCLCVHRLAKTLEIYHKTQYNVEHLNTTKVLNDFHHLLSYHDHQFDNIFDKLGGYCNSSDISQCEMYNRNFRDRSHTNNTVKPHSAAKQILDKIHCYYIHSYDLGNKLTSNELISIHANDEYMEVLTDQTLIKMKGILSNKIKTNRNQQKHRYNISTLSNDSINNQPTNLYGFGEDFKYGYTNEQNFDGGQPEYLVVVNPKYNSLKEEVISNPHCRLTVENFNSEYGKAMIHFNSYYSKYYGFHREENQIEAQLYGDPILQYILALMIYCNFDAFQYELSKTYRDNISDHCYFYHIAMNLKKTVNWFGSPMHDEIISNFYHGINKKLAFPAFVGDHTMGVIINCPLSTTSEFAVAVHFTHERGLIFEFSCNSTPSPKYFSTCWLSDFGNEREQLFVQYARKEGFPLQIKNIHDVESNQEYEKMLDALKTIDFALCGDELGIPIDDEDEIKSSDDKSSARDEDELIRAIFHDQLSDYSAQYKPFERLAEYGRKIVDTYFKQEKDFLDIDYKNKSLCSVVFDILFYEKYEWINIDVILYLFPNVRTLTIKHISACSATMENIVEYYKNHCNNRLLEQISILPNSKSDLSIESIVNNYSSNLSTLNTCIVVDDDYVKISSTS
eukprot:183231_1